MRFGSTKPPSSPSKPPSSTDTSTGIFAVACTLQSHLHAIEQRFLSGRETNDSLKRRKNELTEVLRLFRIVEENEVALSNELEEEVEVAVRESGLGYEDAAEIRLDPGADVEVIMERSGRRMRMRAVDDKENGHPSSLTNGKPGSFKPRVAIPPRWMKVIALSASPSRARTSGSSSAATTTLSGTGTPSGTLSVTGTGTLSGTSPGTLPDTGTPPLSLNTTLSQPTSTPDTASISSSTTGTTGGLGLCGSLRTTYSKSKSHNSKSKVKSTMSKKNFKMKRRRLPGSDGTWSAKPYKTRTTKRSRSASLRSPVLVVHYKTSTTTPGSGSGNSSAGGLGGGGMWNATRTHASGAGTGVEGEFRFVM